MRKPQNTKAAAQRLARVMAHQPADDEEEEDDLLYDFDAAVPSTGIGLAGGRQNRNRSPMVLASEGVDVIDQESQEAAKVFLTLLDHGSKQISIESVRSSVDNPPPARPTVVARPSPTVVEQPKSARSATSFLRPAQPKPPVEQSPPPPQQQQPPSLPSLRSSPSIIRPAQPKPPVEQSPPPPQQQPPPPSLPSLRSSPSITDSAEESQPPSARSTTSTKSPSYANSSEQPLSARFAAVGRPNLRVKTNAIPPSVPQSAKPAPSGTPAEFQTDKTKDKRLSLDFGTFKYKEATGQQSSSALQDELDMLQEENDTLLEKLRLAEERCEESESRTRQLEKQIASLGEGVSLEARLLSRKEADLQKREAALKMAAETYGGSGEELTALRMEAEVARDEAASNLELLHEVEQEAKSLRTMTQRMILSHDEMEEVVLKRCWLAHCWSLCVKHGIHAEIAGSRNEYWSSLASRPAEVILAAGHKAKDENSLVNNDLEEREEVLHSKDRVSNKPNVESMLLVEKGLRELSSLKVEEAIAISMAQKRRLNVVKSNGMDELKMPVDGHNFPEAFELSQEESDEVLLKQAWLMYFWRRAKNQGLELDIAEERLQFWIKQGDKQPSSHDAVDVERSLIELRKLGIETKLWEECRRLVDQDSTEKTLLETEYQILG